VKRGPLEQLIWGLPPFLANLMKGQDMSMDFEQHRRSDRSIDLVKAYTERYGRAQKLETIFLMEEVEIIWPISSTQVAALTLAIAKTFDRR